MSTQPQMVTGQVQKSSNMPIIMLIILLMFGIGAYAYWKRCDLGLVECEEEEEEVPLPTSNVISGCMDPIAFNYDSTATSNVNSCEYRYDGLNAQLEIKDGDWDDYRTDITNEDGTKKKFANTEECINYVRREKPNAKMVMYRKMSDPNEDDQGTCAYMLSNKYSSTNGYYEFENVDHRVTACTNTNVNIRSGCEAPSSLMFDYKVGSYSNEGQDEGKKIAQSNMVEALADGTFQSRDSHTATTTYKKFNSAYECVDHFKTNKPDVKMVTYRKEHGDEIWNQSCYGYNMNKYPTTEKYITIKPRDDDNTYLTICTTSGKDVTKGCEVDKPVSIVGGTGSVSSTESSTITQDGQPVVL